MFSIPRARVCRSLCTMLALCALASPAHSQVLGSNAAGPIKGWSPGLEGLEVGDIAIRRSRIVIHLGGGCDLLLTHPSSPGCHRAASVGNAAACFVGSACPDLTIQRSALAAAGALKLPWMVPSGEVPPSADALAEVRKRIGIAFWRNAFDEVREMLEPVLGGEVLRVDDWASLLPLAARVGLGREALGVLQRPEAGDLPLPQQVALRVTVLMGPDLGAAVAVAQLTDRDACALGVLASSMGDMRSYHAALHLSAAIRARDPGCFDAYATEAEAATRLQDLGRQRQVVEAAMKRFPGDRRLKPLSDVYMMDQGRELDVLAALEKRLAAGDRTRLLLDEVLSFYVQEEGRTERIERFVALAESDETDKLSALIAGVMLAHDGSYARSQLLLHGLDAVFTDSARLRMVIATNAFNLGRRIPAERYILQAQDLAAGYPTRDPDVPGAVAEIFRDTDRNLALGAVATHLRQVAYAARPDSEKLRRLRGIHKALVDCAGGEGAGPCAGPWEHFFDQVGLNKAVVDQAAMVVDLQERGLIGTGTDGPPADLMVPPGMTRPPERWEPGMDATPGLDLPDAWQVQWMEPGGLPAEFELPPGFEVPEGMLIPEGFELPEGWTPQDGAPPGFDMPDWFEFPEGWTPADGPPPGFELPEGFEMPDDFEMPEGFEFPEGWQYGMPEQLMDEMNVPKTGRPYLKRAPVGMARGLPYGEATIPGTMPPGYEAPEGWKPGDPLLPGMTPPNVEELRAKEAQDNKADLPETKAVDPGNEDPPEAKAKDP